MNKFFEKIKAWKDANPKLWLGCSYGGTALLAAGIALAIALPIALAKPATTYRVTFVTDGGTELAAQEVKEGELLSVTNPSKEQYLFSDWYADAALTNRFDPAADKVESDLTLFAEWVPYLNYELNDAGTEWAIGISTDLKYFNGNELILPERYQGKPVTSVKDSAFTDLGVINHAYTKLVITSSYKSIGIDCFAMSSYKNLIEIKPGSLTEIPNYAFHEGYLHDTTVIIPKNVTKIGDSVFSSPSGDILAVLYGGNQDEWDAIDISASGNTQLTSADVHFFTENGREETRSGSWWYYEPDGSAKMFWVY